MRKRWKGRGPTARDLSRLALARANSRLLLTRAEAAFADAARRAFQVELAAAVRQISPFALALLDQGGVPVEEVLAGMLPPVGWPDSPGIPAYRHIPYIVPGDPGEPGPRPPGVDVLFPDGGEIHVHVVDHSIEAAGQVGGRWFVSLFGRLWVDVHVADEELPDEALLGQRLEDVMRLPDCLKKAWRIDDVAATDEPAERRLLVRTGVSRFRMSDGRRAIVGSSTRGVERP